MASSFRRLRWEPYEPRNCDQVRSRLSEVLNLSDTPNCWQCEVELIGVLPCFAKRCRPSVAGKLFTVALRGRRMEGGNRFDKFARSQQVSAGGQDQRRDRMTTTVPALQPTATCGMAIMAKASAPGRTKRDWYRR